MPTLIIFALVIRAIVIAVRAFLSQSHIKPKSLCTECTFAHIQFGACGRNSISCTYGGGVRSVKLDVLYCTDFRPRTVPIRPPIGFIPQDAPAE